MANARNSLSPSSSGGARADTCVIRVQGYSDLLGLARLQLDLRPAHQSLGRLTRAGGQPQVDLRDLGSHPCSGIADGETHLDELGAVSGLGFHLELGVGEARVGESVAEREERLDPRLGVSPAG